MRPPARCLRRLLLCAPMVLTPALSLQSAAGRVLHTTTRASDPVIAAAGDIACDPRNPYFNGGKGEGRWCRAAKTAAVIASIAPDAVLPLGDAQYNTGTARQYRGSYDHSWGALLSRTFPTTGNHDYESTPTASGYFRYFGERAQPPGASGHGYYSYDLGTWHLISLNSNCSFVHCAPGSAQYRWLRNDLRASSSFCTLAYWHAPRYSSGPHGNDPAVQPFWRLLYRNGADVILDGHDHIYERFRQQDPSGRIDKPFGLTEFVVGTGGAQHYWIDQVKPHSVVRDVRTFGVLEMTLHPANYDWNFRPAAGGTFTDAGTGSCHAAPA